MGIGIIIMLLLGVALLAAPIGLQIAQIQLDAISSIIMTSSGIGLLVICGILFVITKLYVRSKANEAFVRTGMGGAKVIKDGGAIVIPIVHEIIRITLETLRLEVQRIGTDALITSDYLRVDVGAEFYVRVGAEEKDVLQAGRSLGDKMLNDLQLKAAVEDKLISALRSVAATKTLADLHSNRETFVEEVSRMVAKDLEENGLVLETVTLSKLDQTDVKLLNDDNVFDARGKRTISEIVEQQKTERNALERAGEQARKQQDVETRQRVLTLEQEQQNAEARQKAEVAKVFAEQDRAAKEKAIEAQKAVELADVQKQQALEVAAIAKQKAAQIAKEQQAQDVAAAAKEKSAKEAELATAQAKREAEQQKVKTVEVEATAEREKRKQVIAAEAAAEQQFVSAQRKADAEAYRVKADADARKASADAEAEAITKKATAEANAAKARAEGERAQALVPVQVERERVTIDQDRIENVIKPELEAREKSGKVAQEFEISKLKVEADKQVRIESAKAMATVGSKITMSLYGTPENAAKMLQSITMGQQGMEVIKGFQDAGGGPILETAAALANNLVEATTPKDDPEPEPPKPIIKTGAQK